jgi:TonB family protein
VILSQRTQPLGYARGPGLSPVGVSRLRSTTESNHFAISVFFARNKLISVGRELFVNGEVMKVGKWFTISVVIHFLVFFTIGMASQLKSYKDFTYIEFMPVGPHQAKNDNAPPPVQKEKGGIKLTKSPDAGTNQQPDESSGTGDFIPYYMVEELPMALTAIDPPYPEEARRLGVEGKVVVLIYIDRNGAVKNVEIKKSPNEALSKAAAKAIYETRFTPAKIGGQNKGVVMQFTLKFRLE